MVLYIRRSFRRYECGLVGKIDAAQKYFPFHLTAAVGAPEGPRVAAVARLRMRAEIRKYPAGHVQLRSELCPVFERLTSSCKCDPLQRERSLRKAGKLKEARVTAREAAQHNEQAERLLAREKGKLAELERDRLARLGIKLAKGGNTKEVRAIAAQAQRWDRLINRLAAKGR